MPFPPGATKDRPEGTTPESPKKSNGELPSAAEPQVDEAPLPAQFSEDALAVEWVRRHGEDWRYVAQWGMWFKWRGDAWKQDKLIEYFEIARNITREARAWPGCDALTKSDQLRLSSARTAAALLHFVKADRLIAAEAEQWDREQMYLGVPGAVVDLITGQYLPPDRAQYVTKQAAVAPQAGEPSLWLNFLNRITEGDADIIGFLQRFAGYCLTGSIQEHAFVFLYGTGANGKTTFVQTILGIMGEYALTTGMETFAETKTERHSTEIARLRGARLVATEETASGSRWNESRIKRLTGGGRIAARFMRQDDFEFEPNFKLIIAGNHKPSLRADEAMKRRVNLVPLTVTIPEADRDKELPDKLRAEWPQILGWMLDGCMQWRQQGLNPGPRIREATTHYVLSNDTLGDWLTERCELNGWSEGKLLHADFVKWCDEQGEKPWSRRGWSDAMIDRGFKDGRKRIGTVLSRGFEGVKLALSVSHSQPTNY